MVPIGGPRISGHRSSDTDCGHWIDDWYSVRETVPSWVKARQRFIAFHDCDCSDIKSPLFPTPIGNDTKLILNEYYTRLHADEGGESYLSWMVGREDYFNPGSARFKQLSGLNEAMMKAADDEATLERLREEECGIYREMKPRELFGPPEGSLHKKLLNEFDDIHAEMSKQHDSWNPKEDCMQAALLQRRAETCKKMEAFRHVIYDPEEQLVADYFNVMHAISCESWKPWNPEQDSDHASLWKEYRDIMDRKVSMVRTQSERRIKRKVSSMTEGSTAAEEGTKAEESTIQEEYTMADEDTKAEENAIREASTIGPTNMDGAPRTSAVAEVVEEELATIVGSSQALKDVIGRTAQVNVDKLLKLQHGLRELHKNLEAYRICLDAERAF